MARPWISLPCTLGLIGGLGCAEVEPFVIQPAEDLQGVALLDRVQLQATEIRRPPPPSADLTQSSAKPSGPTPPSRLELPTALPLARDVTLVRMELTKAVSQREPVALNEPFTVNERAMVFFEFTNLSQRVRTYHVIWRAPTPHPPHEAIEVRLPKAERHRTWAYSLPLLHPGRWTCELRDHRGVEVATLALDVN